MFGFTRTIYKKYHNYFAVLFILLTITVWLLSPLALDLIPSTIATALSFGIVILMLSLVQDYLDRIEPPHTSNKIFQDQFNANEYLISYIREHHIQKARLIEYDGETVKPVIIELLRHRVEVHLLLQHPEYAVSNFQKTKILHQIACRDRDFFEFGELLQIDYYKDVASLRGRSFDQKLISIGWYTYDRRVQHEDPEVWGHTNPVITLQLGDNGHNYISQMFDTVFTNLQKHSESFAAIKQRFLVSSSQKTPADTHESSIDLSGKI